MGVDDIPTSFGYPTIVKTFLPGFITALMIIYILVPALIDIGLGKSLPFLQTLIALNLVDKFIIIITIALISGQIIQTADIYIYQFLEGIRFWPSSLRKHFKSSALTKYNAIIETIESTETKLKTTSDESDYLEIINDISHQTRKMRRYPFRKKDIQATDLGNVIAEYETYSVVQYGMDFNLYWNKIWEILSNDVKTDLDLRGSKTDFIVYLTFISLVSIPLIAFRSYQLWGLPLAFAITILSWFLTKKILYKLALSSHANYGGYIESVFDLYRLDLAKKLGLPVSLCPNEDDKIIWQQYADFLADNVDPASTVFRARDALGDTDASDLAMFWNAKGNAFYGLGEYDEAINVFDKAIKLNPNYAEAWNNKGNILTTQGKNDEAIKYFDEAIRLDPNLAIAWVNKYLALQTLGRTAEAGAVFTTAKWLKERSG